MKKFALLIMAILCMTTANALPLLVGHRGSGWGVENTVESFTNGALKGYQYLETDIKVTSDGKYVCSHNDDLSAVGGGSVAIASNTLEYLQSIPLKQTRSGVAYTGRLCSLAEYLDVCKQYNVKPLMELKWATHINSNDCSGIPALIKFIEDHGFRNSCIILTSMKPCLEYIRKNYPDVELQFLTGQYWANHFDWCVELGIDVNIQAGYFDKSTVVKYHDKGLKVNMWTTNDAAGYRTYGNMGCDFITTDRLDPNNLPELDASVTFPPNTVDFPNIEATIKGSYDPELINTVDFPAGLASLNIKRAIMRDGQWIVLAHDAQNAPTLVTVDPATGNVTSTISTEGVEGGDITLSDIAITADGKLVACNKATVAFEGGSGVWKVYIWDSLTSAPKVLHSEDTTPHVGNWSNGVVGNTMAITGRSKDLKIYVASRSASGSTYRICGIVPGSTNAADFVFALNDEYNNTNWGADFLLYNSPNSQANIIVDSPSMQPVEYTFEWGGTRLPMTEYGILKEGVSNNVALAPAFLRYGSKVYALAANCNDDKSAMKARLYDATEGLDKMVSVSPELDPSFANASTGYMTTGLENKNGSTTLYMFNQGVGLASFDLKAESEVVVEDVELEVERYWVASTVNGNVPTNMDGTNAQQGTAVNGYFYINNCSTKLIHIYNETGEIGTIPGGAGWGCARDDAGNIIVRDDKLTDKIHSFIIYPAGALPNNYGTPVRLTDVEIPVAGQTNFINASGDLLNGNGFIYMYPNKETTINIIAVEKGVVTGTRKSEDIAMTGTTAGYVVPLNNDPENFIYQVRGTGIYFYHGGTNEPLSTERASTTAPTRNSTGGCAYFNIRGNNVFAHNSGANYKGGFTVRNHTKDNAVLMSYDPIGTLGYETGGNYSTFNWLIPERIDENNFRLYQYCPSNGFAVYRVGVKGSSVSDIAADATQENGITLTTDDETLHIACTEAVENVKIYNAAAALMATATAADINIARLPHGMYIVLVNDKYSAKFAK